MMKKLILCLLIFVFLFTAHSVLARELVMALSPYQNVATAKQQVSSVLKFLTGLEPGDSAILLDGYNLTTIGEFTIPDNPAYKSPKARLGANRATVGALMRFAKNTLPVGGDNVPSVTGALRLPQLLRYVSENYSGGDTDLLVWGSPLYDDPKEPEFSMADGLIPGDGHLNNSRSKTPFGTADNPELLTGMRVHFVNTGSLHSDRHSFYIQRFWTLYIEQSGGVLVSFGGDLPAIFRRARNNAGPIRHNYTPDNSTKLEMIRLHREKVEQSIYERPVTTAPLPPHILKRAEGVEIGLSWDCGHCDLDLYARPFPGAQVVFYGHTVSGEARLWKDYRQSPAPGNGRETIAFTVPLDLRALQIAVNFYKGEAQGGVNAELRLSIEGRTYAIPLHIAATNGNAGKGVAEALTSGSPSSPQTLVIDPLHILKLR